MATFPKSPIAVKAFLSSFSELPVASPTAFRSRASPSPVSIPSCRSAICAAARRTPVSFPRAVILDVGEIRHQAYTLTTRRKRKKTCIRARIIVHIESSDGVSRMMCRNADFRMSVFSFLLVVSAILSSAFVMWLHGTGASASHNGTSSCLA